MLIPDCNDRCDSTLLICWFWLRTVDCLTVRRLCHGLGRVVDEAFGVPFGYLSLASISPALHTYALLTGCMAYPLQT